MGNLYSRVLHQPLVDGFTGIMRVAAGRKRTRTEMEADDEDNAICSANNAQHDGLLSAPRKKKLHCTTAYIYKTLFVDERNSDITVHARNKAWKLHKIFLCQSPYFASLFSGAWRESVTDRDANIEVLDPQITAGSLQTVFGSLYNNEITINPKQVISILATATLFQLDGLIERCAEVMSETIASKTVIKYHRYAGEYGLRSVQEASLKWLLVNVLSHYAKNPAWLSDIDIELMSKIVQHPDIVVLQTEFSLYMMLRQWMSLRVQRDQHNKARAVAAAQAAETDDVIELDAVEDAKDTTTDTSSSRIIGDQDEDDDDADAEEERFNWPLRFETASKFYGGRSADDGPYLGTAAGSRYEPLFRQLRVQHLLAHPIDLQVLLVDRIVPRSWLSRPLLEQWNSMLFVDHAFDQGPIECDRKQFQQLCCRCGRYLPADTGPCKWRWTGFNFGMDLLMIVDRRVLSVKRNHRVDNERMLSLQEKRSFVIRVTIYSLNEHRQVTCSQTTDIKPVHLDRNEELQLMTFEPGIQYPLLVSVNLLLTTPKLLRVEAIDDEEMLSDDGDTVGAQNIVTVGNSRRLNRIMATLVPSSAP